MQSHEISHMPALRYPAGLELLYNQLKLLLTWVRYSMRRRDYPLFRIFPLTSGVLYTMKIVHDLGIGRQAKFGDKFFSSLSVPHSPSPAFDRMVAKGGLNVGAAGTPLKQQIDTVFLAVTRRCDLHCQHCYERHNVGPGDELPVARLKQVVADVQRHGVSILVLTGGEPMNRFRELLEIVNFADKALSDIHVHTSGHGVTMERAIDLKKAGLVAAAVGLDDVDPARHDELRGYHGSHEEAVRALRIFRSAGIFTYVNLCATPAMVRAGDLWRYAEFVKELGVGFIQLLEPRPCGGYFNGSANTMLTDDDRKHLVDFFRQVNTRKRFRQYPVVHYPGFAERPEQRGCMMGGLSHLYIDSRGNINPCVFLPVTFGNIMEDDFETVYARVRAAIPHPLHKECPSLRLHGVLKKNVDAREQMPVRHQTIEKEWEAMFGEG
jgi:MoaA/NifB/PqqE/SkfB family radical SAM enzyme